MPSAPLTREELLTFLRQHKLVVLSSLGPDGAPQAAVVGYGVLLLLLLPSLSKLWRRIAVAVAVVMVVGIGFSRVALAAHFVSDVVAGFALGAVWLGLMTAIFRPWRHIDDVRAAVTPPPQASTR